MLDNITSSKAGFHVANCLHSLLESQCIQYTVACEFSSCNDMAGWTKSLDAMKFRILGDKADIKGILSFVAI